MSIAIFQKIISDFHSRTLPLLTNRESVVRFVRDMSLTIVGARRTGKTYRSYQFISEFLSQGGHIKNICRVQFNDHRLSGIKLQDLSSIEDAYYLLYPEKQGKETVYFIFDEIHRVEGWEDFILHLLDEPTHRVMITGSTSRLLSGDIASALRGKNLAIIQYPFSFSEFIAHYKITPDAISSRGQNQLRKAFQRYSQQGGFPGLLDAELDSHIDILQTYWDTMVLRDIIEAHPDSNISIAVFSYFAQALVVRNACPFTVRSLAESMRTAGLSFSTETIYDYLRFLEEAFMIFSVPIYSASEKVRQRNYSKVYVIDWALAQAIAPAEGIDATRQLENMVYIELRRRGYDVSYFRTRQGYEIDFIAINKKDKRRKPLIFQVSWSIKKEEVRERELRGIPETAAFLKTDHATVLTFDEEESIMSNGIRMDVLPVWKWMITASNG
jgi:predicted AAA+ superfamily ATPase